MSVPKYKRKTSAIQFVQTALELHELTGYICSRFPNRWRHTKTYYFTDLSERILVHVIIANSIYATNIEEMDRRIGHVLEAKGLLAVLHTKLDWLVSLNPSIKRTTITKEGEVTTEKT